MGKLRLKIRVFLNRDEATGEDNQDAAFNEVKLRLNEPDSLKVSDLMSRIKEKWLNEYSELAPLGEMDLYDEKDLVSPLSPTRTVGDIGFVDKAMARKKKRPRRNIIHALPKSLPVQSTPKRKREANSDDKDTSVKRRQRDPCQNNPSEAQDSPADGPHSPTIGESEFSIKTRQLQKAHIVYVDQQLKKVFEVLSILLKSKDEKVFELLSIFLKSKDGEQLEVRQ